ncbi:MAG TPA: hypothetical protein VGI36_14540 [Candidatus Binataceae bacterium]
MSLKSGVYFLFELIQLEVIFCGRNREMRNHLEEFSTIGRSLWKRAVDGLH